ncbi:MAG TPA: mandelate racemase/muconate lactonizing enzyme family protein [Stellaceae bacterium]|jgi:D-galactarolactone cycloisomerase|nr:mandelate racemase/muconate lactonizing enzyme family protein [Stellaceae bacterium]
MKIVDVKTYVLEAKLNEPFAYSQAWYETRGACLVEIVGEDGNSGWGEAFGPARLTAPIVEYYKPLLIGEDALATERHWQSLYNRLRDHGQKGLAIEALSAVDIALWDLKARHLGVSVGSLLGGPLRTKVEAYATGFYRKRGGDPIGYLVEEARERVAQGFTGIKLKLGFGMDDDIRLCHAVRRAVGDRLSIMIDANHAYDATGAIALGRRIEELNIAWFEEPVPPEDLAGYREVKSALKIPIAGGEAEFTRWGFRTLIADRCVDILQPDIAAAGGISETKKIADMANAFGVRVNPHVWGTAVALAASLQLIASLPHNPPGLHPIEPLLEFDQSEHPIRFAVSTAPIVQRDGWVAIPDGPGIGIEIDRDALTRFKVA